MAEHELCKLGVTGSNPVASILRWPRNGQGRVCAPKPWRRRALGLSLALIPVGYGWQASLRRSLWGWGDAPDSSPPLGIYGRVAQSVRARP